jgi:hypothetical protein
MCLDWSRQYGDHFVVWVERGIAIPIYIDGMVMDQLLETKR